jgi:hypothetical protein
MSSKDRRDGECRREGWLAPKVISSPSGASVRACVALSVPPPLGQRALVWCPTCAVVRPRPAAAGLPGIEMVERTAIIMRKGNWSAGSSGWKPRTSRARLLRPGHPGDPREWLSA